MGHYVIIGGGGFLGAHVISTLQKNGCNSNIIVVDPYPRSFETITFDSDYVTIVKESFLDVEVLDKVLPEAEAVFHLAAVGHTGITGGDPKLVHDFNVCGTKQLVEKCKIYGVKRFIFASSVAVSYIGKPLHNISEDEQLPCKETYMNYYSSSKAEAENIVLSESTENFKTVCLRFRAIYGPEDPNVTGKVANLIRKGMFIAMVSVHGRESISSASSAVNCAKAFYLADVMLQKPGGLHGRVYYIMDGENIGQYSFWNPLIAALGRKAPTIFIPFKLVAAILPIYEFWCYHVAKYPPMLTRFELSILATDNTYSIERARLELNYEPEPSQMPQVAEYYQKQNKNDEDGWTSKVVYTLFVYFLATAFYAGYLRLTL